MKVKCGDANPKGNVEMTYKGGCRQVLEMKDAYRCVGCGGWFHYDCILKHFELEKGHDNARYALGRLKEILDQANSGRIIIDYETLFEIIENGLKPTERLKK